MDSQFSLRWNNYVNQITNAFGSLLHKEDLVDVTLNCEGKNIKAHKMLLSACSPYFHGIFKENPCQHPVIVFRNVQFVDLKAIVEFVYCGEVNVLQEQLESFLSTAEMLDIKGLSDKDNESGVVETGTSKEIETDPESAQTGIVKEQIISVSTKQISSASEISGHSSPPAKRRKTNVGKPRDESPPPSETAVVVKEEIDEEKDILDVQDVNLTEFEVSDPFTLEVSRPGPKTLQHGSFAEFPETSQDVEDIVEEFIEEALEPKSEKKATEDETVKGGSSTIQQTSSHDVQLLKLKTKRGSVPFKKRKNIAEKEIYLEDENKSHQAECAAAPTAKPTESAIKSKVQIPKGLVVTAKQAESEVQHLFDFPTEEPQVELQHEASPTLRSEDAKTPIHEEITPYCHETPVRNDASSQPSVGEPEIAEEAPTLQEEQNEPEPPAEEEPEFDYFGCEICRNEAKPVDLERLVFNHKCPICPCACFCAHLLKDHMRAIHGWFNVQRRFTHY